MPDELSYRNATGLMRAHAASRQAAMYELPLSVTPPDATQPAFEIPVRATYTDFFPMFDVPFEYGSPWSAADDAVRAPRVVVTRELNDRLFGGANSVGRTLTLSGADYTVVGVLDDWQPRPRFYDLKFNRYGDSEQAFIPFTNAITQQLSAGMAA